jgi:hypothetical protein
MTCVHLFIQHESPSRPRSISGHAALQTLSVLESMYNGRARVGLVGEDLEDAGAVVPVAFEHVGEKTASYLRP